MDFYKWMNLVFFCIVLPIPYLPFPPPHQLHYTLNYMDDDQWASIKVNIWVGGWRKNRKKVLSVKRISRKYWVQIQSQVPSYNIYVCSICTHISKTSLHIYIISCKNLSNYISLIRKKQQKKQQEATKI